MSVSHRRPPIQLPDPVPAVPLPPGNDPAAVREWASAALKAFGLDGWRFEFTRAVRQLGVCRHLTRVVGISKHHLALNSPEQVRGTLLHEIAHALVGPGHGHGPVWKDAARRIGAKPERCNRTAATPPGRVVATCGCGRVFRRHRRPKRRTGWFCKACGPVRGKLVWTREGQP